MGGNNDGKNRNTPGLGQRQRIVQHGKITKYGQSIVSLWPLCRVCNITNLLCTHHLDTETGQ